MKSFEHTCRICFKLHVVSYGETMSSTKKEWSLTLQVGALSAGFYSSSIISPIRVFRLSHRIAAKIVDNKEIYELVGILDAFP